MISVWDTGSKSGFCEISFLQLAADSFHTSFHSWVSQWRPMSSNCEISFLQLCPATVSRRSSTGSHSLSNNKYGNWMTRLSSVTINWKQSVESHFFEWLCWGSHLLCWSFAFKIYPPRPPFGRPLPPPAIILKHCGNIWKTFLRALAFFKDHPFFPILSNPF